MIALLDGDGSFTSLEWRYRYTVMLALLDYDGCVSARYVRNKVISHIFFS